MTIESMAIMSPPVSTTAARILIADDQHDVIEALRLLIKPEGFQIDTADSPGAVQPDMSAFASAARVTPRWRRGTPLRTGRWFSTV